MNNHTIYYIQQSITQDQSMTWIFLPLVLCIALLCMQIDGTVAINIKWNLIHTLTQIVNKGDNIAHNSTPEPHNEDTVPSTTTSAEDSDKNAELLSRIQSLERALDAARQDNMSLEAQRQSLQRICHVLVQQEEPINQDTHHQINEIFETVQRTNHHDIVPLETANDVTSIVSREPARITLDETAANSLPQVHVSVSHQPTNEEHQEVPLATSQQHLNGHISLDQSSLELTSTHLMPESDVELGSNSPSIKMDTYCVMRGDTSPETASLDQAETVEMTRQLLSADDPLETTRVDLSDDLQFAEYPMALDTTTYNEQTKASFSMLDTPTADRLLYQDPVHVYDVDLNADSVLVQIEKCLLVAVAEPTDWMSHVTELKYLQHMLEDVPLADSIDLVADHLLLLAEHVRTLIFSPVESVVGVAWLFVKFLLRIFGAHLVLFLDVVLASLRNEIHILLHLYEATQADEIKLLILKQLARILSSSTMEELTVPLKRLENFVVEAVKNAKTEEALGTDRQVFFAFFEMRDMTSKCASDARSDTSQDGQPVLPSSPRLIMKSSNKMQSPMWVKDDDIDARQHDDPQSPKTSIYQACTMRDELISAWHTKVTIPVQETPQQREEWQQDIVGVFNTEIPCSPAPRILPTESPKWHMCRMPDPCTSTPSPDMEGRCHREYVAQSEEFVKSREYSQQDILGAYNIVPPILPTASPKYYMRRMPPPRAPTRSQEINARCHQEDWAQPEVAEVQDHLQNHNERLQSTKQDDYVPFRNFFEALDSF
ncbi:hypothetical protein AC1031_001525 [Aphanomyces cochlioides]|nr:hypothetical protein AC1031_001525 [Aphanomyces cochlioides]